MQVLLKHVNETPEPPSTKSELAISGELDELVLNCLAKNPNDRPRDAEELSSELRKIPLERPWKKEDARLWWQTHRPV